MDQLTIAYCAGVIDSDGYIGVRKTKNESYWARIIVKQVTIQAIDLLQETWPAYRAVQRPSTKKGRPLHVWEAKAANAGRVLADIRPYLRIKQAQADNALEACRAAQAVRRFAVPEIVPGEPMVTMSEAAARLGKSYETVHQAVREKSVPALHGKRAGSKPSVLIPESFLAIWATRGNVPKRSPEVVATLEACWLRAKELNQVGI